MTIYNIKYQNGGSQTIPENIQEIKPSSNTPIQTPKTEISNFPINDYNIRSIIDDYLKLKSREEKKNFNYGPINEWDVTDVYDMSYLFKDRTQFNEDISNWNTQNVKNMESMFEGALNFNNNDLSIWNVSNVKNMRKMFRGAVNFNPNIFIWRTINVENMEGMFSGAINFNPNKFNLDTSKVTNMSFMFHKAELFNKPIIQFDVSKVTNMESMFESASNFNQSLATTTRGWNTANVKNMRRMFKNAENFNNSIGSFITGNVESMEEMFMNASVFNQNINTGPAGRYWNMNKVKSIEKMFYGARNFNQNLSSWSLDNVIHTYEIFKNGKIDYDLSTNTPWIKPYIKNQITPKKIQQSINYLDIKFPIEFNYLFDNYIKNIKNTDLQKRNFNLYKFNFTDDILYNINLLINYFNYEERFEDKYIIDFYRSNNEIYIKLFEDEKKINNIRKKFNFVNYYRKNFNFVKVEKFKFFADQI